MRDEKSVKKLQRMFNERFKWVLAGGLPEGCDGDFSPEDKWTIHMNSFDCLVIDRDDLLESFADMVNFGNSIRTHVCLWNPANKEGFLLVPQDFNDKCLALGGMP